VEKERDVIDSIPGAYDHPNIPNKRVEYGEKEWWNMEKETV